MSRALAVLTFLLALAPAPAPAPPRSRRPRRAPRRPEPDHLRRAPRPVQDRRLRDAAEGGHGQAAAVAGRDRRDGRAARRQGRRRSSRSSVTMLHHLVFTNGGPDDRRARPARARCKTTRERFWGTSEELRPLTLPPGYGYPTDPADKWRAFADGHAPPRRRARVLPRVPRDRRPAPDDPGQAVLAEHRPVLARPAVDGPRRRQPGRTTRDASFTMPEAGRIVAVGGHLHGGAQLDRAQPAALRATARSSATVPAYAPAGDPLYKVRPLLHEPDPKNISWWQSATGLADQEGRAAEGHRRLRQHAPAHARDGDRARLRRAAARPEGGRPAARPRRADAQRARRGVRAPAHDPAEGHAHARPRSTPTASPARPPRGAGTQALGRRARVAVGLRARLHLRPAAAHGPPRRDRALALRRQGRRTTSRSPTARVGFASPWLSGGRPLRATRSSSPAPTSCTARCTRPTCRRSSRSRAHDRAAPTRIAPAAERARLVVALDGLAAAEEQVALAEPGDAAAGGLQSGVRRCPARRRRGRPRSAAAARRPRPARPSRGRSR